jgi:hypothetical protein
MSKSPQLLKHKVNNACFKRKSLSRFYFEPVHVLFHRREEILHEPMVPSQDSGSTAPDSPAIQGIEDTLTISGAYDQH